MNEEEKKLCKIVEYMQYLDIYNKSDNWNKGYFKKLNKLVKDFCRVYAKNHWGWKYND